MKLINEIPTKIDKKEYVRINYVFWKNNETKNEYYDKRRKNLDINGYKNYKLVIIK